MSNKPELKEDVELICERIFHWDDKLDEICGKPATHWSCPGGADQYPTCFKCAELSRNFSSISVEVVPMKQLYVVALETEIIVLADNAKEAENIALKTNDNFNPSATATEMTYWPDDWEDDCLPYGSQNNKTIKELVDAGAAPKLKSSIEANALARKLLGKGMKP